MFFNFFDNTSVHETTEIRVTVKFSKRDKYKVPWNRTLWNPNSGRRGHLRLRVQKETNLYFVVSKYFLFTCNTALNTPNKSILTLEIGSVFNAFF